MCVACSCGALSVLVRAVVVLLTGLWWCVGLCGRFFFVISGVGVGFFSWFGGFICGGLWW